MYGESLESALESLVEAEKQLKAAKKLLRLRQKQYLCYHEIETVGGFTLM